MTENQYQARLIKKLYAMFPGCIVLKLDSLYQQGILDLIILYGSMWASLEVKASGRSRIQANQRYFVERLDDMSFAAFIHPDNEAEVLDALQQTFESEGRARVP